MSQHARDVSRSTPVHGVHDDDAAASWRRTRPPLAPPAQPPPASDDNTADDASSTPLDGTPRSQASCSTLTAHQQQTAAGMDDSLIRVELSGDTLTVSEPTHMSWDEVHHRLIIIYTLMTYYWSSCVGEFA